MNATGLSSIDQIVYKKISSARGSSMTQAQVEQSLPTIKHNDVVKAIIALFDRSLVKSVKDPDGGPTTYKAQALQDATQQNQLTDSQQQILRIVNEGGTSGMSSKHVRNKIGSNFPQSEVKKALDVLVKGKHLKAYKNIQTPTVLMYINSAFNPTDDMTGGVWYGNALEWDQPLVNNLASVALLAVRNATFPGHKDTHTMNILRPANALGKLIGPEKVLAQLRKVVTPNIILERKHAMEIMRMLELDGKVQIIKPIGISLYEDGVAEDEPSKKRSKGNEEDDEERRVRQRDKEEDRMREKRRKAREKERRREKEKKDKRRAKKAKAKAKKSKEKSRKHQRVIDSGSDSNAGSDVDDDALVSIDDPLVSIDDLNAGKKSKKGKSSEKSSKRRRQASPSPSPSVSLSESDSDSSQNSRTDDSDDSNSSISSNEIDTDKMDRRLMRRDPAHADYTTKIRDMLDLTDTAVVYRALRSNDTAIGHSMVPCGNCPVFDLCQEGGPVNATDCQYWRDWLSDDVGGWTMGARQKSAPEPMEARLKFAPEPVEETKVVEQEFRGDEEDQLKAMDEEEEEEQEERSE